MIQIFDAQRIGKKIADARKECNMTQMELADELGVSYQAVSNWERSKSLPDIDKYNQISQVLDLSLEDLLGSHEGARTIQIVQNDEPMPVEYLVQAAPLMKPAQVEQKVTDKHLSFEQIVEIAPFISDETLEQQVDEHLGEPDFNKQLHKLAPFLSSAYIKRYIDSQLQAGTKDSLQLISKLVFALDDDDVDAIFDQVVKLFGPNEHSLKHFYPFLSDDKLRDIAQSPNTEFKKIRELAPFLDDDSLNQIFHKLSQNPDNAKELSSLAPFLEEEVIVDYLKNVLPTQVDDETRKQIIRRYLPFLSDKFLLNIF